jgi:hypothetical protein
VPSVAGVGVETWCRPALSNAASPYKSQWAAGDALPPSLALYLPFHDVTHPTSPAAANSAASVWLTLTAILALGAALR